MYSNHWDIYNVQTLLKDTKLHITWYLPLKASLACTFVSKSTVNINSLMMGEQVEIGAAY